MAQNQRWKKTCNCKVNWWPLLRHVRGEKDEDAFLLILWIFSGGNKKRHRFLFALLAWCLWSCWWIKNPCSQANFDFCLKKKFHRDFFFFGGGGGVGWGGERNRTGCTKASPLNTKSGNLFTPLGHDVITCCASVKKKKKVKKVGSWYNFKFSILSGQTTV